ncbi:calcium-binding protein, partial [Pseudomonas fluorescens]
MGSRNLADGGAGDDHIRVDIYMDTVLGGEGDDFIVGTDQLVSHLLYERGNYMSGGSGNDDIRGSMGSDTLSGDEGNDTLHATPGIDILEGGVGADIYD